MITQQELDDLEREMMETLDRWNHAGVMSLSKLECDKREHQFHAARIAYVQTMQMFRDQ